MSHSPDDLPENATLDDLEPAYLQSVVKLNQMLDRGVSWSGHEANCCFLNTGTGSFANVSAITGLDFLDDGRGLALVDWDRDGDLDAWTSNRSAPMLRFVRNDSPLGKHYLLVRLEGVDCNLDAIGARVVVELEEDSPTKLTRTLHAGEGFLGQSSKWLHFGLGENPNIAKLTVHWPNGEPEIIRNVGADRRYNIRQGTGNADAEPESETTYNLVASPIELPTPSAKGRALLSSRLPLPPLKVKIYDSRERDVTDQETGPVLLNIWASWCRPCLAELRELSEREQELRAVGLNVFAANVDSLGDERGTALEKNRVLLEGFGYPFDSGVAAQSLAAKMESIVNFVYGPNRALPVPTSFLIDSSGKLAAIYKGGLSVDQLLDDVAALSLEGEELGQAALPFAGRWIGRTPDFRPIGLAAEMAESGIDEDILTYLRRSAATFSRDAGYAKFASEVARKVIADKRYDEALRHLREATKWAPQSADLWGRLGEVQLQLGDSNNADRSLRKALTLDERNVVANFQLGNLLSRLGKLALAARFFERAIAGQPDLSNAHYQLSVARFQLGQTEDAVSHMERFVELRPEVIGAKVNLGGMLASLRRFEQAERHLRSAVESAPDNSMARNNLGRVLQDQGKGSEAVEQFEIAMRAEQSAIPAGMNLAKLLATSSDVSVRNEQRAVEIAQKCAKATNEKRADVLDVLAVAQNALGRHAVAVETADKALRVAKAQGDARLVSRVTKTLEQLKRHSKIDSRDNVRNEKQSR